MVLCNPRDREAALRAETEGIATHDPALVTCPACLERMHRQWREQRSHPAEAAPAGPHEGAGFVRIRDSATMVSSVREGDGVDPRIEALRRRRPGGSRRKADHGAARLAGQIFDCLRLSTVLSDAGLDEFAFVGVTPGGRSGQFLVDIACTDPQANFDHREIERVLAPHRTRVRAEVSHCVHRRKAPDVTFRVRLPGS